MRLLLIIFIFITGALPCLAFTLSLSSSWSRSKLTTNAKYDAYGHRIETSNSVLELDSLDALEKIIASTADDAPSLESDSNSTIPKFLMLKAYGANCKKCAAVAPKFIDFAELHPEVLCCAINLSSVKGAHTTLGVKSVPLFIVYAGGERVDDLEGMSSLENFEEYVDSFCEEECAVNDSWA